MVILVILWTQASSQQLKEFNCYVEQREDGSVVFIVEHRDRVASALADKDDDSEDYMKYDDDFTLN
jgi:hypothetical protein